MWKVVDTAQADEGNFPGSSEVVAERIRAQIQEVYTSMAEKEQVDIK